MAQVVNNTDKLTYILTNYGLERVAQALADTSVNIYLSKIKVGDANYEYYEPVATATELKHPIEDGSFYIIEKDLLEDGLTVSLHALLPEKFNGCEIREVGIYETVNGKDYLFALSTQQPLLKPSADLDYFISVDYFAFLKSQNLSDIYDQIYLDPNNQLVTQEDLDKLMSTILFTESNLMEQINGNSRIIGLNRAQQLHEKMEQSRENFGYITSYNNYSLLLNYVNPDNIFAYWLFNYPRRVGASASVVDISKYGRNLSTNLPINIYERVYDGIMPTLKFEAPNYFYMIQSEGIIKYNPKAFTFTGEPIISALGIASGFSSNDYVKGPDIKTSAGNSYTLRIEFNLSNLAQDQSVMMTSTTYSFRLVYDKTEKAILAQFGNGITWTTTLTAPASVEGLYNVQISFNGTAAAISFLKEGVYVTQDARLLSDPPLLSMGVLVIGAPNSPYAAFGNYIDLKQVSLSINGIQSFSGSTFESVNDMSFTTPDQTSDISFSMAFALEPLAKNTTRTLIARSDYATNSNVFEITEREDNSLSIKFFTDSENYINFYTSPNTLPKGAHSLVFSYDALKKSITAFAGAKKLNILKDTHGTYTHMNVTPSLLYSFTYAASKTIWADSDEAPTSLFNENGTPYVGDEWSVSETNVFFKEYLTSYDSTKNVTTDKLYSWVYNDGLDDYIIYTKTLNIQADTTLYNADYTLYTGTDFKVTLSGSNYIIQYLANSTENEPAKDIQSKILYAYSYAGSLETIWANSSSAPTALYKSNGDVYEGSDWTLSNNIIYYKDGGIATYNSAFNITIPTLPVTSYVIGSDGNPTQYINSNIGAITVIKETMNEEQLRSFALNLEATMGNNPCIKVY